MKKTIKSFEKALLAITMVVMSVAGNKAFADEPVTVRHSPIFESHYYSSNELANDIESGKLKMSESVTELFFINFQLQSWNEELVRIGAMRENGNQFQLESEFESLANARKYFAKVLKNYCTDKDAVWLDGEYKLARAQVGQKNAVTLDWVRGPKPGEKITKLDPNSIPEVSQADGKFDLIDGFSLYCGNSMFKVAKKQNSQPIVRQGQTDTIYNTTVFVNRVVNQTQTVQSSSFVNYGSTTPSFGTGTTSYVGQPSTTTAYDNGNNYSQTHDNGNTYVTYNVHDNGNSTPVVMKQNNGPIVAAMVMNGLLTAYAIWQQGRWQQMQPSQYYSLNNSYYNYNGLGGGLPSFQPTGQGVQGFATQGSTGFPIQGNTGFATFGSPVQGNTGFAGNMNGWVGNGVEGFATFR